MPERSGRRRGLLTAGAALVASAVLAGCLAVAQPPPPPGNYTGLGFDTCAAPSTGAMGAWLSSPYHSIGVYIGGGNRACAQNNLSAQWVGTVANWGWRLAPLYVGLQAPCINFSASTIYPDPGVAGQEGIQAAQDAVLHANLVGLGAGTPIYFDMEAYNNSDQFCSLVTMSFLNAWDYQLHAQGYKAGVYSSAASGMVDLASETTNPGFHLPDAIWFAHWNGQPTVFGDPYIADNLWADHQRLHQDLGGHNESYSGVVLTIDTNADDGPLAG